MTAFVELNPERPCRMYGLSVRLVGRRKFWVLSSAHIGQVCMLSREHGKSLMRRS